MRTCHVVLFVLVSLVATAHGQQPPPVEQPTFRAEVALVEVVAVVTGEDDRSLTDLTLDDFDVREDGEPRALLSARRLSTLVADAAGLPTPVPVEDAHIEQLATNTTVGDAPAFVLLLDDLDTSPYDSHRMIRAAEGALAAVPDSALVAVVTTSGVDGSLLTLSRPGPEHIQRVRDFRGRLLLRPPVSALRSSVSAPCGDALQSLDCGDPTRAARRADAVRAVAEILGRAGARRKVLLWLTVTMGVSPLDPDGSRRAQRQALLSAVNNDVAVYVVDPRENRGTDDPIADKRTGGEIRVGPGESTFGGGAGGVLTLDVDDLVAVPLTQITRETGGRYVTDANNLQDVLGHIVEQNTTSYLLTYESRVTRQPGRHTIDVRVRRPNARVYARTGYVVEPASVGDADHAASPHARLLRDTLLGSVPQGTLPIAVHAAPRFAAGRQGHVVVTIRLDDDARTEPVDLVLATVDDEGRFANQQQMRLVPPPPGRPWELTTELPLQRGRHQLRVAGVTADASRTGLVLTPVEIIEPGRELVMVPPVLLGTTDGQVHPTSSREFVTGTVLGLQTEVGGRPVQQRTVSVRAVLVDATGGQARTVDAVFDPGARSDRQRATAVVSTDGLAPGRYAFVVEAHEGGRNRVVRHAVPITLTASTDSRRAKLDTEGGAERDTTAAPVAPSGLPAGSATTRGAVAASVMTLPLAHGPTSLFDRGGTHVIRTPAAWRTFWQQVPTRQAAPDVDFDRVMLLAVVLDDADASAQVPQIDGTRADGTDLVVLWRSVPAAATASQSAASRRPFVVVGITDYDGPVRFERVTP